MQASATDSEVAAALSGSVESHDASEFQQKKKKAVKQENPKKSQVVKTSNSDVVSEVYEGLDAKEFASSDDAEVKKKPPTKKVEPKK
jgi:hypothetical protein